MESNEVTQQVTGEDSVHPQSRSIYPSVVIPEHVLREKRQTDRRQGDRRDGVVKKEAVHQLLMVDERKKVVCIGDREIRLTPKEFKLFGLLSSEPGRIYSVAEIIDCTWPTESRASVEDVQQYIYMLRRKLEIDPKQPELIVTVHGFGYGLELPNWER
jgi:DNA-binding response OmpR family regulator